MRLRTLRQQQLEDDATAAQAEHGTSSEDDQNPVSATSAPFNWQPYGLLDRHLSSLAPLSLFSSSRLSLADPSAPVPLDSLLARLYASSQLLRWSYPPLDVDNSNGQFPLYAPVLDPYVSACRFDRLGSLLACASSSGRLTILDMDVALAQPLRQPARTVCAEAVRSYNLPGFRIDCLRWHPTSDDSIVVSSGQHPDLLQFDLNHSTEQPTTRSTLPNPSNRHLSTTACSIQHFTFLPTHPHTVLASTGEGALQWWDLRAGRTRNPVVPPSTAARLPCGVSASAELPMAYVWRQDASVDVYDVRRLPADRKRVVYAWRLGEGVLTNRVKAVEPDDADEARFLLETEGGAVSTFDLWRGSSTAVEGRQRWAGDMAAHGGRRRRMAWMRGLGGGGGRRLQRGCMRIVAHATGGTDVKFSRVALHSRGHHTPPAQPDARKQAADEMDGSIVEDGRGIDDDIEWSDEEDDERDDVDRMDDTQHIQTSIHTYFQPFDTPSAQQPHTPHQPQPSHNKPHTPHALPGQQPPCACCSHVVGRVCVGGGGVSVLESHPVLDMVVCGLMNNALVLVGAGAVADEGEESEEGR